MHAHLQIMTCWFSDLNFQSITKVIRRGGGGGGGGGKTQRDFVVVKLRDPNEGGRTKQMNGSQKVQVLSYILLHKHTL